MKLSEKILQELMEIMWYREGPPSEGKALEIIDKHIAQLEAEREKLKSLRAKELTELMELEAELDAEKRDFKALAKVYWKLEPKTARMEKRIAQLEAKANAHKRLYDAVSDCVEIRCWRKSEELWVDQIEVLDALDALVEDVSDGR